MIDNSIETIIFDFGGVLINVDYQKTIDAFIELGVTDFESMYSQAEQESLFNRIETGDISAPHFINSLLNKLPQGTSPNKVVSAWNAMVLDVPSEVISFLEAVKQKYKVYLLSNTNELHIVKALRELKKHTDQPLESFFNKIFLSHDIGLRKPNAEIFEFVINDQKINPKTTLFIDDSIQHIEGAKKTGLQTYHLKNQEEIYALFS